MTQTIPDYALTAVRAWGRMTTLQKQAEHWALNGPSAVSDPAGTAKYWTGETRIDRAQQIKEVLRAEIGK